MKHAKTTITCLLLSVTALSAGGCSLFGLGDEDIKLKPSEEYYLGRSCAAQNLANHPQELPVDTNRYLEVNRYLTLLTNYLYNYSADRGGLWRPTGAAPDRIFVKVINADGIEAWTFPGGFILISKGLIKNCANEDELACVLAHELSHVINKDSNASIEAAREKTQVGKLLGGALGIGAMIYNAQEGGSGPQLDPEQMAAAGKWLGESISGVIDLIGNGWPKEVEYRCDADGGRLAHRAGYSAIGLSPLLDRLTPVLSAADSGQGLASAFGAGSHGSIEERKQMYRTFLGTMGQPWQPTPESTARFERHKATLF